MSSRPPLLALIAVLFGGQFAHAWTDSSARRASADTVRRLGDVQVSVWDAQGRVWNGRLDHRTDDRHLWLKNETPAVRVVRALAWTDIVQVQYSDLPDQQSASPSPPPRPSGPVGRTLADQARDALLDPRP